MNPWPEASAVAESLLTQYPTGRIEAFYHLPHRDPDRHCSISFHYNKYTIYRFGSTFSLAADEIRRTILRRESAEMELIL